MAAAVLGDLRTGASGTLTITLNGFAAGPDPAALPVPGPPWNANVGIGTSLTFAGCTSGTLGSPGCLFSREGVMIQAVGTTLPINTFLQFEAHPNLLYSLTAIGPGSATTNCGAALVGDSCSPFPGSPFILTRAPAGTTITIPLFGRVSDSGLAGLAAGSPYVGQLAGFVAGQTPAQVQLFFCPSGTCVAADFTSGKSLTLPQSGDFLAQSPP